MFWIMIYVKVKNEMKSVCLLAIVLQRNVPYVVAITSSYRQNISIQ